MLFPNKLFTYSESVISKFPLVLQELSYGPIGVVELYKRINKNISGTCEYMDVLDCLFALNKIAYDDEKEVLFFVR